MKNFERAISGLPLKAGDGMVTKQERFEWAVSGVKPQLGACGRRVARSALATFRPEITADEREEIVSRAQIREIDSLTGMIEPLRVAIDRLRQILTDDYLVRPPTFFAQYLLYDERPAEKLRSLIRNIDSLDLSFAECCAIAWQMCCAIQDFWVAGSEARFFEPWHEETRFRMMPLWMQPTSAVLATFAIVRPVIQLLRIEVDDEELVETLGFKVGDNRRAYGINSEAELAAHIRQLHYPVLPERVRLALAEPAVAAEVARQVCRRNPVAFNFGPVG